MARANTPITAPIAIPAFPPALRPDNEEFEGKTLCVEDVGEEGVGEEDVEEDVEEDAEEIFEKIVVENNDECVEGDVIKNIDESAKDVRGVFAMLGRSLELLSTVVKELEVWDVVEVGLELAEADAVKSSMLRCPQFACSFDEQRAWPAASPTLAAMQFVYICSHSKLGRLC